MSSVGFDGAGLRRSRAIRRLLQLPLAACALPGRAETDATRPMQPVTQHDENAGVGGTQMIKRIKYWFR